MLWIAIAFVLALTLAAFVLAWRGSAAAAAPVPSAVALFRAQKRELAAQQAAGLIGPAEAAAAEAEAARRLLAAEAAGRPALSSDPKRMRAVLVALAVGLPALSLVIYAALGAPRMPDQPLLARQRPAPQVDMAAAVARIEQHLAANPEDGRGFEVLAPVYLRAGRFEDAVRAYARSVALNGATAARLTDLAEARIAAAGGVVTAQARADLESAAALEPALPKLRYYQAVIAEQDGDIAGARRRFAALRDDLPPGPQRDQVAADVARLDPASSAAAIAALPEAERREAIRSMVAGLAQRLESEGGTLEDWSRLVRSQATLGDRAAADAALARALKALGAPAREALATLARDLGLEPPREDRS